MPTKLINVRFIAVLAMIASSLVHAVPTIIPAAPDLAASAYMLLDADSGKVLVSHNVDQRLPPASLTKIMTSYIAANELNVDFSYVDSRDYMKDSDNPVPGEESLFIHRSDTETVSEISEAAYSHLTISYNKRNREIYYHLISGDINYKSMTPLDTGQIKVLTEEINSQFDKVNTRICSSS